MRFMCVRVCAHAQPLTHVFPRHSQKLESGAGCYIVAVCGINSMRNKCQPIYLIVLNLVHRRIKGDNIHYNNTRFAFSKLGFLVGNSKFKLFCTPHPRRSQYS